MRFYLTMTLCRLWLRNNTLYIYILLNCTDKCVGLYLYLYVSNVVRTSYLVEQKQLRVNKYHSERERLLPHHFLRSGRTFDKQSYCVVPPNDKCTILDHDSTIGKEIPTPSNALCFDEVFMSREKSDSSCKFSTSLAGFHFFSL